MRMFLAQRDEFSDWKMSQDVVWEKHNGSGFASDRFKRVHELVTHWYRGEWSQIRHETPRILGEERPSATIKARGQTPHTGQIASAGYRYGSTRLMRSVIYAKSMHRKAIHPTEKPVDVLAPLVSYSCPPGGVVLDPFAGSGSTAAAVRHLGEGRKIILIEADERYCERIAERLILDAT
jgi:site-specific DNA-methyltransferase (adenine-specific)